MPDFSGMYGTTFNPGNLTVNRPGQFLYPGQIGTYSSPNGFTYATFPNGQTGFSALVDYIRRHVSQWGTTSQFVTGYLGTGTPNAANPYPSNYLTTVQQASGLNGSIGTNYNALANGIVTAEGNPGAVNAGLTPGAVASNTNSNGFPGGNLNPFNWFNFNPQNIATGAQCIADPNRPGCREALATTPGGNLIAGTFGVEKALGGANLEGTLKRGAYVLLAIVLIAMALAMLAAAGKTITIQQVARGLT